MLIARAFNEKFTPIYFYINSCIFYKNGTLNGTPKNEVT